MRGLESKASGAAGSAEGFLMLMEVFAPCVRHPTFCFTVKNVIYGLYMMCAI